MFLNEEIFFLCLKFFVSDDKISGSKKLNAPYEEIILEKKKFTL